MGEFLTAIFGTLTVVFQCVLVGGCTFAALVDKDTRRRTLRLAGLAGAATALAGGGALAVAVEQLTATLGLSVADALGADFARHAISTIVAALVAAGACVLPQARRVPWPAVAAAMAVVLSSATSGHADSRLEGRLPLVAVAFVHQLAAAIWLGGIPFLLLALRATPDGQRRIATCRRFSALATASVAALAVSAAVFAVVYVGSWPAVIGSDFGAMAAIKAGLFGVLLLLGLGNLRAGAHLDQAEPMRRLRAFAMAEIGIGLAVLTVAAALAVQAPPAEGGAVMAPDALVAHLTPHWPSFTAAIPTGPGTAADRAWGEMTHHWAGLLVLAMGLLALLRPLPGFGWARHWPLLFALIAIGIALLANPGSWPLGDFAFRDPGNAEAMPYRLAALLVLAFGAVEWAVQTGRLGGRAALTFPLSCGVGGFLLFTLGHPGAGGDDTLLIHLPHMAIATLGVVAGAGRWIELAGDCHSRRLAAHVWPLAFALSGAVLLLYREG